MPPPLAEHSIPLPYLALLDDALSARLGKTVSMKVTQLDTTWFWADIPAGGKLIRIGFPKSRLLADPTTLLLFALFATVVFSLLAAYILARRITRPLAHFSQAARHIGAGSLPQDLPHSSVQELADLAVTFNQMALQVRELLANRTTLLAGISHDLRTPLARMQLGIEMLPENSDPKIVERLRRDIEDMNALIGEFLTLGRDLQQEAPDEINLETVLHEMAEKHNTQGPQVACHVQPGLVVRAGPLALHRVVQNLLGNALRYSNGKTVELNASRHDNEAIIEILDRGPGIPPHEIEKVFRPFYRIETSRNTNTGGSGLGLAIVRQLCAANGWQVALHAREGGGTVAEFRLPLSASPAGMPQSPPSDRGRA